MILTLTASLALWLQAEAFDRPDLLALAPAEDQPALQAADQHILVVRHAYKVSPDCNGMDCPLSPQGEAMVVRLGEILGDRPVDRAYASAACRTRLTAAAGQAGVVAHQAVDGYAADCTPGETITRPRSDAFSETRTDPVRWTLAGEHSNTTCLWLAEFAGVEASETVGCSDGRLPETAYGDIFWLHAVEGDDWQLTVLPGAFLVDGE